MKLRNISGSSIQYIVIQNSDINPKKVLGFVVDPTNEIFYELINYPKDFIQFENQFKYLQIAKSVCSFNTAINCLILPGENIEYSTIMEYSSLLGLEHRTCVYFIDGNCERLEELINAIEKANHSSWFFNIYNNDQITEFENKNNYFQNSLELISLFKKNFQNIKHNLKNLGEGFTKLNFGVDNIKDKEFNFIQLMPNYRTKYQLQNKFWKSRTIECDSSLKFESRNFEILKLLKEIDNLHISICNELDIEIELPILIAVFPFIDSQLNAILKRMGTDVISNSPRNIAFEQNSDYTYSIMVEKDSDGKFAQLVLEHFIKPKFKLIDSISYLHSSFKFSPIVRFPLISRSIYKELSFLNPKYNFFDSKKALRNKIKAIKLFGEKLESILIEKSISSYLQNRNGQILAISDLPIEWLSLNKIPLALTHDITRIQESNFQGNLNNYSANNRFEYKIEQDILKRTLVILSDDANTIENHEFAKTYKIVEETSTKLGFHYRYCKNKKEVADAVAEINPYLLIFDCHGDIDNKKETNYLIINNEKIYGEDIIEHKISAPIVFLSCCNSNPNLGFIKKLHDAFFQVGAVSVTGTFQPISIRRGTRYYIRMLNLLQSDKNSELFKNWLAFISHVIRSSIIHDFLGKATKALRRSLTKAESEQLSIVIVNILVFEKRREVFERLLDRGISLSEELKLKMHETDSEMLMYTHYGRPDLIYFA